MLGKSPVSFLFGKHDKLLLSAGPTVSAVRSTSMPLIVIFAMLDRQTDSKLQISRVCDFQKNTPEVCCLHYDTAGAERIQFLVKLEGAKLKWVVIEFSLSRKIISTKMTCNCLCKSPKQVPIEC